MRKSCYWFFDTSNTCKRPVSRCYSSTTDAKNCCTNPTILKPSSEFVCHYHTKVLPLKCFSLLRLFRTLQKKWLSHTSKWFDCGIKNKDITRIHRHIKKQYWLIFQCVLSLSSSMFAPTKRNIHTTIINASSRHQNVFSSWTYIAFAIMWHKHIRYISNIIKTYTKYKYLLLNIWSRNCESLCFCRFCCPF